jgi:signal transduction histidine kinase
MSLRTKVLLWIIAVNLGIAALLWTAIHGSILAQREAHTRTLTEIRENREEVIKRFSDILSFEEELSTLEEKNITTHSILNWDWDYFDDAVVLKKYVEFEGQIIYTDIELNPLGSRRRSPSFDREAALDMLKSAIEEDRRITEGDSIAIPIHVRNSTKNHSPGAGGFLSRAPPLPATRVWGAAYVRPRFPEIGGGDGFFDPTVFWVAMVGGTLILIAATYVILSRLVIRPVEEMARVAGKAARGDFSTRCSVSGTGDEVGRLILSFNFMVDEVGDYHRHLQDKVAEAQDRVQLAERHLAVAQRLASTGKLAAGVAHEINNPIGGMINAAIRLDEEAEEGTRLHTYLGLIIDGLERIKKTVRSLLAFSPREMDPQPAEVRGILEAAQSLIAHRLVEEEISLTLEIVPPDLDVVCEAGEIRQVILNILINAVDAIPSDRAGEITLRARRDAMEKVVVLEVSDNGCGMSGEQMHDAFDPFFSTKAAGDGTGLGLSIAHNIVTGHKGRIELESSPGVGTTTRIILPAV